MISYPRWFRPFSLISLKIDFSLPEKFHYFVFLCSLFIEIHKFSIWLIDYTIPASRRNDFYTSRISAASNWYFESKIVIMQPWTHVWQSFAGPVPSLCAEYYVRTGASNEPRNAGLMRTTLTKPLFPCSTVPPFPPFIYTLPGSGAFIRIPR